MGTFKKVALLGLVFLLAAAGVLYIVLSRDNHDASKDKVAITPPPPVLAESSSTTERETESPEKRSSTGFGRGGLESEMESTTIEGPGSPPQAGLLVGSRIDLTLSDQHEEPVTISADTETLILALSKGAGDMARFYLDEQASDFLPKRKAVFVADISPIPVLVRNLVLRTLKKRSYQTLLIYDTQMADSLRSPDHDDKVSIVSLRDSEVVAISHASTKDELHKLLAELPDVPAQ